MNTTGVNRIYVRLRPEELRQLGDLARAERRDPADQAAHMLAERLQEATTKNAAPVAAQS